MSTSLLTVLMTVYNGEPYLTEAVSSMLSQTYRDFRFLILDNASTDNSREVIRAFNDPRIELVELPENIGQVAALNKGLAMIDTPFTARLDADDIAMPARLEKEMNEISKADPKVAVVGCWLQVIDREGRPVRVIKGILNDYPEFLFSLLRERTPLYHPSVIFRTQTIRELGGYDTNLPYAEDFDLWARLALAGYQARVIPEPLCCYRVYEEQQSVTRGQVQRENTVKIRERIISGFCSDYPPQQIRIFFDGDKNIWREAASAVAVRELVSSLKKMLENIRGGLKMDHDDFSKLRQLFRAYAGRIAIEGASSRGTNSRPLFRFALEGGPGIWRWLVLPYLVSVYGSYLRRVFRKAK
jgi:glycosyltransferase involved in cell wall biosynthesis